MFKNRGKLCTLILFESYFSDKPLIAILILFIKLKYFLLTVENSQ